jgi:hypothetical protein
MKFIKISMAIALSITLLAIAGCGSTSENPTAPQIQDTTSSAHQSWGAYDMIIDLENESIEIVPNREIMYHFNINGYLGLCDGGCFKFWITDINGTVLTIDMQMENPVALDGYDVRIIFTHLNGKTVLNPDSYTNLWDPSSTPENANPFIAFMKSDPLRHFNASPSSDKQILLLDFPPGASAATTWIIDASHPSNCLDVYEINSMEFTGDLTPTGGSGIISCKVLDHQDDIEYVAADTVVLTGGIIMLDYVGAEMWEAEITNSEGAPEGDYIVLIKAMSLNPMLISTYNYVTVNVNQGSTDPCGGSVNMIVCADGNWVVDNTIDVDMYDGLQFVQNILDYEPNGAAANYNTVYYWGGHGGSFRNGNTTKLQELAENLGYTFRKQESGDLNIDDVRVLFWPGLGHGDLQNPPSDDEINAIRNLLSEGGRMIINCEYDTSSTENTWINLQLDRLGSCIRKNNEKTTLNTGLTPEECAALTNGVNSVLFRAWGYLYTVGDAFTLFYDPRYTEPMMMIETIQY